jgi:hypothetical protein
MPVSSSLIAAQSSALTAAREAQARFQAQIRAQQAQAAPQAGAMNPASPADGFAPLSLKQVSGKQVEGPAQTLPRASPAGPRGTGRLGQHIDITV